MIRRVPNMKYTFQDAMAEILPHNVPEYFWQKTRSGELEFAVPGWDVRTVDYAVALVAAQGAAVGQDQPPPHQRAAWRIQRVRSTINQYLRERGDARVKDWASWVANAKFKTEAERRAGRERDGRSGSARRSRTRSATCKMQSVMRMVILKVMYENKIDVFVNPEQTTPPYYWAALRNPKSTSGRHRAAAPRSRLCSGAPEADVPAGYVRPPTIRKYVLSAGQEGIHRGHRRRCIEAAKSDADQHDVLGRPRHRFRCHQGGVCL